MLDFVYEKDINKLVASGKLKILYDGVANDTRGLALSSGRILINLSCPKWNNLSEDVLISEITKTIIHEHLHILLYDNNYSLVGEERVCQLMADQVSIPNKNNNIYI